MPESQRYKKIKAIVGVDSGAIRWEYQIEGLSVPGCQGFDDEDASDWTDEEIKDLTASMLDVPDDQKDLIEVVWD